MKISDKKIIELYKNLNSYHKVADKIVEPKRATYQRLKNLGVLKTKTKTFDKYFFKVDSPELFYWAGFLVADGFITHDKKSNNKYLGVELSNIDDNHLYKFKDAIGFSGETSYSKRGSCKILLNASGIIDDLAKFNIVPNKSLVYEFPKWMKDHDLCNHFVRGIVDGDGSFYYQRTKGRNIRQIAFDITGTKNTVQTISKILSTNCKLIKAKNGRKVGQSYKLQYVGNNYVAEIRQYLYKDANPNIYLTRKYNKVVQNDKYILGLDLALNSTGFCIINNGKILKDEWGLIQPHAKWKTGKKLNKIDNFVKVLIRKYRPATIVFEDIFKGPNIQTFKHLSMVRGVVILRMFKEGYDYRTISLSAVQARSILKIGKTKEQAFADITKKHKLNNFKFNDHNDIVDAIVLGLACHEMEKQGLNEKDLNRKKLRKRRKKRKK